MGTAKGSLVKALAVAVALLPGLGGSKVPLGNPCFTAAITKAMCRKTKKKVLLAAVHRLVSEMQGVLHSNCH